MNEATNTTARPFLPALSRRGFLGGMAAVAAPSTALAVAVSEHTDRLSPEERIQAAVREIEAAMAERFPGFTISAAVDDRRPMVKAGNTYVPGDITRSAVLIYAYEERYGREEARWFVNYPDMQGAK